jgi:uncharacterized phage-associated protein
MLSLETMSTDDLVELDSIRNRVLLLYAMNELEEYGSLDKWKIQKTCFFSQYDAQQKRIKSTNYQFFKWKHGPMSVGINSDLDLFNSTGLVQVRGANKAIEKITNEGHDLAIDMAKFIESPENRTVTDHLNAWIHRLGKYSGTELREMSHRCQVPYRDSYASIEEIPVGTPLLYPIKLRDVSYELDVPKEWIQTLELVFSYRYSEIKQVLNAPFKANDLLKWSDVFEAR